MEAYTVKVDVFEGPLDLLLHLIKQNQIDIYDIPIALVTEQYLDYIRIMKALDLTIAGEFLVMAATLMYIKSRMLLPPPIDALRELVKRQEIEDFHEVTLDRVTLQDKMTELWEKLQGAKEAVAFSALFTPLSSRLELIVTFLALLELIRSGMLRAYQRDGFGPVWVTR